jgi:hypothetical protein
MSRAWPWLLALLAAAADALVILPVPVKGRSAVELIGEISACVPADVVLLLGVLLEVLLVFVDFVDVVLDLVA